MEHQFQNTVARFAPQLSELLWSTQKEKKTAILSEVQRVMVVKPSQPSLVEWGHYFDSDLEVISAQRLTVLV